MKTLEEINQELDEIDQEEDLEERAWKAEATMRTYEGDDQVISFKDWLEKNKGKQTEGFSSGVKSLDAIIGGFHVGDLITITGATGNGKSSFAQHLTSQLAEQGKKCLWFQYEMPIGNFLAKFGDNLPEGYTPNVLNDTKTVWIERRIIEAKVKYDADVVFIDHLHYLFDLAATKSVSLEIGNIMRSLKKMALKYHITIFVLAHTVKTEEGKNISINSLRDSSFVGQESDTVIALWRVTDASQTEKDKNENGIKYTDYTMINVCKNRHQGRMDSFKMRYLPGNNFYSEDLIFSQEGIKNDLMDLENDLQK